MQVKNSAAEPPKAQTKIDYAEVTRLYNEEVQIGGYLEMPRVYNATLFRKAIARRGLDPKVDFSVRDRKPYTYLIKNTDKLMQE